MTRKGKGYLPAERSALEAFADPVYLHQVTERERDGSLRQYPDLPEALAKAWSAGARPKELILDIDASLLTAHSEKQGAAGNYKGGFGFHPLLCYPGRDQRAAGRNPAPRQRRGKHRYRSLRGAGAGPGAAARG